jgi:spore maturation protein CgeB
MDGELVRWLIGHPGPQFSVSDVYDGWVEALGALGQDVATFNLDDRLQFYDASLLETGDWSDGHPEVRKAMTHEQAVTAACAGLGKALYDWWPDVVLLISGFFVPESYLDLMRARGHKVVLLHTEEPYEHDLQHARAAHADINLLNDPCNIGAYRDLGMPAEYMPHAYRPHLHTPGPSVPNVECDLGFVGTGFQSRIDFFTGMDLTGLDVLLAGHWKFLPDDSPLRAYVGHDIGECLGNDQAIHIYRSARAGINFYRREAEDDHAGEGWACGPREIEQAACGLFFLRDPRGEGDELFRMLPTFDGPQDASEKLRWWLAHDGFRGEAARQARAAVEDRTFGNNAKSLLRLLDRQPIRM